MKRSTGQAATGAILMAVALLLAGCGSDGGDASKSPPGPSRSSTAPGDSTSTPQASPSPSPSSISPAPAPAPADELLVAATVSGGIDGRHQSMLINGDGSYTTLSLGKDRGKGQMEPAELTSLRTALADADFAKLPRINLREQPVPDGLTTAVIYQGHEVVTDGSTPIPELDRVIAALPPMDAGR
ncbi:hypothetical protein [Streptomyces sp. NPDC055749]